MSQRNTIFALPVALADPLRGRRRRTSAGPRSPGSSPARPAATGDEPRDQPRSLKLFLPLKKHWNKRFVPAAGVEVLGELPRRFHEVLAVAAAERRGRPSSRRCNCPPSGSASSRAAAGKSIPAAHPCGAGRRRPSRRSTARTACPRPPSRAARRPSRGTAVVHGRRSGSTGTRLRTVRCRVGQAVVVALVAGQAVAVHLRQEAQVIRQGEVPDAQRRRPAPASRRRPSASACPCASPAAASCGT